MTGLAVWTSILLTDALEEALECFSTGQTDLSESKLSPNPQWSNSSEDSCPTSDLSPLSPRPKSAAWAQNDAQSSFTQLQPRMRLQFVAMLLFFLYSNENLLQRRTGANKSEFSVCDGRSDTVKAAIASHVIISFFLLHNCTAALMASADHRGSGSRGVGALMTLQIKEDERCGCASAPPRSRRRACWECRLKNAPFQKRLRGGKSLQQHRYEKLVTGTP